MHQMTLLTTEVNTLRHANEALSKRRRVKKTRLRLGGALNIEEAQELVNQRALEEQIRQESRQSRRSGEGGRTKERTCSRCKQPGHNKRRCQAPIIGIT
jgi:hypothetical protein